MVGIWQSYAGLYLIVAGIGMLAAFGLPLLLAPMAWARVFRWDVAQPGQLAVFLARSLGVLISVLAIFAFRAAETPAAQPFFFELMLWTFVAMLGLHIYGAIRRTQPMTETVEIALWVALFLVTLAFYPS